MISVLKFFRKFNIFFSVLWLGCFFPGLLAAYFQQVGCQNWMLGVCRRLLGKKDWKRRNFPSFWPMDGKFRPFDEFLSSRLSNIPYTCPQYSFDGKVFFEQNICILRYSYRKRTILAFRWIFLAGLSKLHSWCREEHFEEKIILGKNYKSFSSFFYTARKVFGLLAKLFWQIFVWTALYMSIKTFWEKKIRILSHFSFLGILSETFSLEDFPAVLWNLGSTCPLGKVDQNEVFLKTFLKHL